MPTPEELDRRADVTIHEGSPLDTMIKAHRKPVPDSAEWWRDVAEGLGVKAFQSARECDSLRWVVDNIYTLARRELRRLERAGASQIESVAGDRWGHVLRLCEQTGAQSRAVGVLRADAAVDPQAASTGKPSTRE